ncbi:hypothetical protein ACOMHN_048071 [Nucella lapillus]
MSQSKPGPVRLSLVNLDPQGSPRESMSMPGLARTPDRHGTPAGRTPALKPFPSQASKQLDYRSAPQLPAMKMA